MEEIMESMLERLQTEGTKNEKCIEDMAKSTFTDLKSPFLEEIDLIDKEMKILAERKDALHSKLDEIDLVKSKSLPYSRRKALNTVEMLLNIVKSFNDHEYNKIIFPDESHLQNAIEIDCTNFIDPDLLSLITDSMKLFDKFTVRHPITVELGASGDYIGYKGENSKLYADDEGNFRYMVDGSDTWIDFQSDCCMNDKIFSFDHLREIVNEYGKHEIEEYGIPGYATVSGYITYKCYILELATL